MNRIRLCLLLICTLYASLAISEESAHWGDESHKLVSHSADEFVNWLDRFFYSENFEVEAAEAYMRLQLTQFVHEVERQEFDVGFRGRVSLPALNKRGTLIISDNDQEDQDQQTPEITEQRIEQGQGTNISIQFTEFDQGKHRLDYRLGVRSSGAFKGAIRYRYRWNPNTEQSLQIRHRLRFRADEGFENRIQLQHDTLLDKNHVLRLQHTARYGEITRGLEWNQYAGITHRVGDKAAVTGFIEVQGITDEDNLTTLIGLGVNYRRQFFREWMYLEARPAYYFERENRAVNRRGRWRASLRVEIVFD